MTDIQQKSGLQQQMQAGFLFKEPPLNNVKTAPDRAVFT